MERTRWSLARIAAGLLLAAASLFIPGRAQAQAAAAPASAYPREVYARVGSGELYDDEGSLGTGLSVAGGFAWQVSPRWGFGGEFEGMDNERTGFAGAGGFIEGDGLIGSGSVHLYLFPDSRHQLYLSGGVGVLHYRRTQFLPDVTIDGRLVDLFRDDTETKVGWRGAVGARFNLHPRWTLRLEGSLFAAETEVVEAPFTWLQASVGAGFRF
jgi:opacity protein-like surface antigen